MTAIYIDQTTISQFYDPLTGYDNTTNQGNRMWLSPVLSNVVNNYVGSLTVTKSRDYFKGTFLINENQTLYQIFNFNYKTFHKGNRTEKEKNSTYVRQNKSLLTCTMLQSEQFHERRIQPAYFYFYFQGLGGFWAMFTSLSTWVLRPYISFQYSKSGVKKLYKYSRTKRRKRTLQDKIQLQQQNNFYQEDENKGAKDDGGGGADDGGLGESGHRPKIFMYNDRQISFSNERS